MEVKNSGCDIAPMSLLAKTKARALLSRELGLADDLPAAAAVPRPQPARWAWSMVRRSRVPQLADRGVIARSSLVRPTRHSGGVGWSCAYTRVRAGVPLQKNEGTERPAGREARERMW
eukprot:scaffold17368_cov136-Isochrysis_galbana.AAC.4